MRTALFSIVSLLGYLFLEMSGGKAAILVVVLISASGASLFCDWTEKKEKRP